MRGGLLSRERPHGDGETEQGRALAEVSFSFFFQRHVYECLEIGLGEKLSLYTCRDDSNLAAKKRSWSLALNAIWHDNLAEELST